MNASPCSSATVQYFPDNSMVVQLGVIDGAIVEPLHDEITLAVITTAVVTCRIRTKAGVDVAGPVWPQAMPHSAGGIYYVTLPPIPALLFGVKYDVVITSVDSGVTAVWTIEIEGWKRTA